MDKISIYRQAIKSILNEYHDWISQSSNNPTESCLIFDEERSHYIWLHLGWQGKKKIDSIYVHVRIKNDKIWIEEDWTEEGIATELTKKGIPVNDIVLAFYPPDDRKYTEFAVT
jgi:XisI protein